MAAEKVGAARGGTGEGWEDEVVVLPERAVREPLFVLAGPVAPYGFCGLMWEHFTERPLPFFGFSKMRPVRVWENVRLTCRVAKGPLRSMSSHIRPRSSPSLRPQ